MTELHRRNLPDALGVSTGALIGNHVRDTLPNRFGGGGRGMELSVVSNVLVWRNEVVGGAEAPATVDQTLITQLRALAGTLDRR